MKDSQHWRERESGLGGVLPVLGDKVGEIASRLLEVGGQWIWRYRICEKLEQDAIDVLGGVEQSAADLPESRFPSLERSHPKTLSASPPSTFEMRRGEQFRK